MSKLLRVSQSVYSRYENNEESVKADDPFIQRLSEEFGVSAKWLVNDDSNINITFEKDSIQPGGVTGVIGQVENNYSVPKDFMDAFIAQQKMLEKLLEKVMEK